MCRSIHTPLFLARPQCYNPDLILTYYCMREDPHTMADVQCVTCGQAGETITDPLFMGRLESEIKAKVCKPCWKKWEGMRVMVINEYQVNLGEESGRELVKKQMKAFLKLGEQTDTGKLDQNYRPPA